jgi:hypothetical protein
MRHTINFDSHVKNRRKHVSIVGEKGNPGRIESLPLFLPNFPVPEFSGIGALKKIKKIDGHVEVISVTRLGMLAYAVEATQCGQVCGVNQGIEGIGGIS